jgi:hypothetical protein
MADVISGSGIAKAIEFSRNHGSELEPELLKKTISTYGLAVLRGAFNTEGLSGLFENLRKHSAEALKAVNNRNEEPHFEPQFGFQKSGMTLRLAAVDPWTEHERTAEDITQSTSLLHAIEEGPYWKAIKAIFPDGFFFSASSIRIIDSEAGSPEDRRGALFFHQEKWALRMEKVPLGCNIWLPLNPDNAVTNETAAGIQFALSDRDFWREAAFAGYEEKFPIITKLNIANRKCPDAGDTIVEADDRLFFRPKLRVGDLAIFDHHMPHASFVPEAASSVRVSCDLRLHPKGTATYWAPVR